MQQNIVIHQAIETHEGAGVVVKRLFPVAGLRNFDPLVLWDHFDIAPGNGFPDHPHRGFEAITYMLKGSMQHTDNLGNQSTVNAGGAQRFTAGKGLVHSEMPGSEGSNSGIQLWINLPRRLKGIDPDYQQVEAEEFPVLPFSGGLKKIIVGEGSPLKLRTAVRYLDIQLQADGLYQESIEDGWNTLIYVLQGRLQVSGQQFHAGDGGFISGVPSLLIECRQGCRFLLCQGRSHGEPIHQHGSFVD